MLPSVHGIKKVIFGRDVMTYGIQYHCSIVHAAGTSCSSPRSRRSRGGSMGHGCAAHMIVSRAVLAAYCLALVQPK